MIKRNWADGKKLNKQQGGYHYLYKRKRWLQRRRQQLIQHPLCAICFDEGIVKAAVVAHHLVDHHGDPKLFYSSPLRSLCKECHDAIEYGVKRGCDINGRPHRQTPIWVDKNARRTGGMKNYDLVSIQGPAHSFTQN
jgi:5-methylcytosine-specific restriction enzyme A